MGKRQKFHDFKNKFLGGGGASALSRLSKTPSTGSAQASSNLTEQHIPLPHSPVNKGATSLPNTEPHVTTNTAQAVSIDTPTCTTEPNAVASISCVTPPAELVPRPKDYQPIIKSTEPQALELSTSQRLWNAAYDSLKENNNTAELAKSYIKTLTGILNKAASNTPASEEDTLASLDDPTKRQEYMKKFVDEGQKKVATSSKIVGTVGDITQFIISAKGMIDAAIQNIPQAALPWAGVCIGLQILLNPVKATKANLAGIAHVTSRMDWYCALAESLLSKEHIIIGNESFIIIIKTLEEAIIALYKALILYQMTSVCSYYRNQGLVFLRGLVNLDDWDGGFESVKNAEATVENMSVQYYREYEKSSLHKLANSGRKMEAYLSDIHMDLRDFIAKQKQARMDDKLTECLRELFVIDPQYDMESIEKKKDKLLDNAFRWILNTNQFTAFINWTNNESASPLCRLLWIKGPAGTGKTMLLIGIIRELINHSAALAPNISYFFCQATDSARNNATAVLRSLLWLLLVQQPHLISHLYAKYQYSGASLFNDTNTYFTLSDIFKSMLKDPNFTHAYLIIDALDECTQGKADLIQLISTSLLASDKVKWLVASRPEVELDNFEISRLFIELDTQSLKDPVNAYINHKLSALKSRKGYSQAILDQISKDIRNRAANIFLWAALVFKQLDKVYGWNAVKTIREMPPGLSELYDHLMTRIEGLSDVQYCMDVLVAISLAYRPLSLPELSVLAGLPVDVEQQTIVEECGSLLTIREETVYLIHQSAKDYLDKRFGLHQDGTTQRHIDMYKRSIKAMSTLKQDIYGLTDFGFKPKDTQSPNPDPLASIQYSCLFWADHLCDASKNELADNEAIWSFLKDHLLHWLESLSLLGKLPNSVRSIKRILQELQFNISPRLTGFLKDIEKFILSYGSIIDRAPLQAYGSALVFSPRSSEVKKQQWKERLSFIEDIYGIKDRDIHLQTLEGHSGWVWAIAFSPDGKTLASASDDKTVRLWDAATGALQHTLKSHSDSVQAIAFSPDSKTLASASDDKIIRLWDIITGALQYTLKSHSDSVRAITFSSDGKTLASVSDDKTVRLWDTATGALRHTLKSHSDLIIFSPDSKTLASASDDKTIQLWDTITGTLQNTLEGHSDLIQAIIFSPGGKTLASASDDKTVRLWDTATGALQYMYAFESYNGSVLVITFSIDGKTLALASDDKTVQLWDTTTGALQQTLKGHSGSVLAIAFSPDNKTLASASDDKTVRLWDTTTGALQQTLKGHSGLVWAIVFSPDGKTLASASDDMTVRLWDAAIGAPQEIFKSYSSSHAVWAIAFSPDGKTLVSVSDDIAIQLWDATKGALQHTLKGHNSISAILFSPSSKILASASHNKTIQLWDAATGVLQHTLKGHNNSVRVIIFSPDNKTLASASNDKTVRLWDTATGILQCTLEGHSDSVQAITFSLDNKTLASASDDKTVRLWDTTTGALQQTLKSYSSLIRAITFSPDSKTLAFISSLDDAIQIWDTVTGVRQQTLKGHNGSIWAIAFSPDGKTLASASRDKTVQLWDITTGALQQILKSHSSSVWAIAFSPDGQFLSTSRGYIRISSDLNIHTLHKPQNNTVFIIDEWITKDGKYLLWLPKDYRTEHVAIHGNTLALGLQSGKVIFLRLRF